MNIHIISVGNKMPDWVTQAFNDYSKRLSHQHPVHLHEIAPNKSQNTSTAKRKAWEAQNIISKIPASAHVVCLDNRGQQWPTEKLAQQLQQWQQLGKALCFIIGGADGLDDTVLERAQQTWCLSALTFPHPLVRCIIIEQLYRAHSINTHHPYHRA